MIIFNGDYQNLLMRETTKVLSRSARGQCTYLNILQLIMPGSGIEKS